VKVDHKWDHKSGQIPLWSTLWSKVIGALPMRYSEVDHMDHKYEPYKRKTIERVNAGLPPTRVSCSRCRPTTDACTSTGHRTSPQTKRLSICIDVVQVVQSSISPSRMCSCRGPQSDFMWSKWTTKVVHTASLGGTWTTWTTKFHGFPQAHFPCMSVMASAAALMFPGPNGWIGLGR
jgi:hypothetical protein